MKPFFKYRLFWLTIIINGWGVFAVYADGQPKPMFQISDKIEEITSEINSQMQSEQKKMEDRTREDTETLESFQTLPNPFVPQLPRPKEVALPQPPAQPNVPPTLFIPPENRQPYPDPTPVQEPPPSLTVQGLIWNSKRPQAIINNQVVDIGDTVQEAKVLAIEKFKIRVLYRGKEFDLPQN